MKRKIVGVIVLIAMFTSLLTPLIVKRKYVFSKEKFYSQTQVDKMCKDSYDQSIKDNSDQALYNKMSELTLQNLELKNTNAELELEKETLQTKVAENESTIASLNAQIQELSTAKESNESTIAKLTSQVESLETNNKLLNYEITQKQLTIDENNKTIEQLQSSIKTYEDYIAGLETETEVFAIFVIENEVIEIQKYTKNSLIYLEEEPELDANCTFNGWKVNDELIDLATYKITCNTTFEADLTYKYDVKFMVENESGEEELYNSQSIVSGGFVTLPEEPTKPLYQFVGWSLDKVNIIENLETLEITQPTVLYAMFEEIVATLDNDYLTQLTSLNSNITKTSVTSMSFLKSTDKTNYLGSLNSGISVYYTEDNGTYELDFICSKIFCPSAVGVFSSFTKLTTLDLTNFDTSNATNMSKMFYGCSRLKNIDLSNFDTSNVTNMSNMFFNCSTLKILNVSTFNTSNVTKMDYMFSNCLGLTSLDVSSFDTSNVTYMPSMFSGCAKLTKLDLSNFDTSNVTHMHSMFYNCSALTSLNLSNFDTSNVINMNSMFYGCSALTTLDLSNFDTSKVVEMSYIFAGCTSLDTLNLSSFDTSSVLQYGDIDMYKDCSALTTVIVGSNYTLDNLPV